MSLDDRGNSIVRPFGQRLRSGSMVHGLSDTAAHGHVGPVFGYGTDSGL